MVATSDPDNYGRIIAYSFPRTRQVYGPAQVHSLINQDVVISEQFTLWDQEGSEVILGKMIIEPTGGALLYIQPVYLQEEGPLKIPQLKRLIMALEDAVVMAPSLGAFPPAQDLPPNSRRLILNLFHLTKFKTIRHMEI